MGAYAELDSLVALEFKARGFSLLRSQPVRSLLYGRRSSHVTGRGLDFQELRGYVPDDDVRTIDWRVTARLQKPYVRVYSEERDRPTMLVVDQRINMFFGSRVSMKSVIAAEISALAAWRVLRQGDRIGAFVFNDGRTEAIRMRRSRANVLRILDKIIRQNHLLRGDSAVKTNPGQLNEVLQAVAQTCRHDALIIVASDFDGADGRTRELLLRISQSNDVVCCLTYDPLGREASGGGSSGCQQRRTAGRDSIRPRKRFARASSRHPTSASGPFSRGSMSWEFRYCPSAQRRTSHIRCATCWARCPPFGGGDEHCQT